MIGLVLVVLQFAIVYRMYREAQAKGQWSWSKFALAIAFALFEVALVTVPAYLFRDRSWMIKLYVGCWVVALVNMCFFIRSARHWRFGPGNGAGPLV
jgi:uncharacterized membrane protein YhaH (DUF805 family)